MNKYNEKINKTGRIDRKRGSSKGMRTVKEMKSRDAQLINTSPHSGGDSLLIWFSGSQAQISFKSYLSIPILPNWEYVDFFKVVFNSVFYDNRITSHQSLTSILNVVATSVHGTEFIHQGIMKALNIFLCLT